MSANHRFLKFWPQDWQRDPALRACGIDARGLWIDMICIMHEGTPYGHLTINGKGATPKQIGTITGIGEKEAVKLLAELEDAGVFSRTDENVIFSRRMIRDDAKAQEGRDSIKRRWGNSTPNTPPNRGPNTPPNREPKRPPTTQESRSKNQEKSTLLRSEPAAAVSLPARDNLWSNGLSILRDLTGLPDGSARKLLGKFVREARDDCALVGAVLAEAADLRPVGEPAAWISAAIAHRRDGPVSELDQAMRDWGAPSADQLDAFVDDVDAERTAAQAERRRLS